MNFRTIKELLSLGDSESFALGAPGLSSITHGALREQVRRNREELCAFGIGRKNKVAIVLPNGPSAAVAFLATASTAIAAPLRMDFREEEFFFYMKDLNVSALMAQEACPSAALPAAERLGIKILELKLLPALGAGAFQLTCASEFSASAIKSDEPSPDDAALVLHTSGTTARPKIVKLTHANLCASVAAVVQTLKLTPEDCGLNVMPLFHIHGLVAGLMAPLASGGRVFCSPGFDSLRFFSWMKEAKPTWYTAVPTMHQALLTWAERHKEIIAAYPLRFIRSSSAAMPLSVLQKLESVFSAPCIEAYGMTEAAHQIASNPLPPEKRIPGTVGVGCGTQIGIMSETGQILRAGHIGEIVLRGRNVISDYENNPDANLKSFTQDAWFRTGDQGALDANGYLTISGRLKEIINRGGEKISPREVDEILMSHSAIEQAVTFAMPHTQLGEDVASAIVLKPGVQLTEREVQEFASQHLTDFKVPRKVIFLDEIPKGATGKVQRIGLAKNLGL